MRISPGRTPALRRRRGGGGAPRAMTPEPFQVRVPSVGWVMRPPAAISCGSSSNEGLPSSTKRRRDTHDARNPVSPWEHFLAVLQADAADEQHFSGGERIGLHALNCNVRG